jgi:hypothetical protein
MSTDQWENIEAYKHDIIEGSVIAIVWTADDVQGQADQLGIEVTEGQIRDVLYHLKNKHDANIGINWGMIDYWIQNV